MNIHLRNLSPEVEAAIVEISRREGISLNKATRRLLEMLHRPAAHSNFDEFLGNGLHRTQTHSVDWKLTN